jgi:osmotically-inducible protein OsmY
MMITRAATLSLLLLLLGGCSDSDHNGQPDTVRPEVRKAAGQALDAAVKQAGKVADNARIAGSIRARLEKDPVVGLYRLRVAVENGTATLTGEVNTAKEKAQAGKLAREQDGITAVQNRIEARSANR